MSQLDESLTPQSDTRSNEDLDRLADNLDVANNSERPMSKTPDSEKKPEPSSKDVKEEYEFIHNGKPVRGTRDQILKWAQMGYDRPQFTQKFNQERAKWDQEKNQIQELQKKYTPYTQIDEWATKNPTQWQQLEALWKEGLKNPNSFNQLTIQPSAQVNPDLAPYLSKIQNLEHQLSQIAPSVEEFREWREKTTEKEMDQKLEQEVQSIKEQHCDLDWQSIDQDGKSLEMRVLEHAQSIGTPSFRAALRDLLHDDLLSRAQAKAQQSVAKNIQNRTKLGILGETPMPQKGRDYSTRNKNIRDTSYEEITQEIFEEMKRGVS